MAPAQWQEGAETLCSRDLFTARRNGRYFVVELHAPHRVLSTSAVCGGERLDLRILANHQSCEARGDSERLATISGRGPEHYHRAVCQALGTDPDSTALMGTAANMASLAWETREFAEMRVDAFVTAGVHGNAARAGDPAGWNETGSGWEAIPPQSGTINILLILGFPLAAEALAGAVVTMTEAKSAALAELAVPSLYSPGLATGTGTDQYCLAAPTAGPVRPRRSTSAHTKAGEIIGVAVREAVREGVRWQNGLEASTVRGMFHALGRFGLDRETALRFLSDALPEPQFLLLKQNLMAVTHDPGVGAAAHAFAAVLDRVRYGSLPPAFSAEALRQQAACLACSVAARPQEWPALYAALDGLDSDPLDLVLHAVALGWSAKWT